LYVECTVKLSFHLPDVERCRKLSSKELLNSKGLEQTNGETTMGAVGNMCTM
jgi:hypothetical protein